MGLSRSLWITGISLLVLSLALPVSWHAWPARSIAPASIDRQAWEALGQLHDQHGRPATASLSAGKWVLVFFGFTHCADICPATLSQIGRALDHLDDDVARRLQPVFVTLDPRRDTPEHLARYLEFFDERLLGLSGTPQQIEQVVDAWGIYSREVPTGDSYMLDHSTTLFLLGPDGELRRRLSGQLPGRSLAEDIAAGVSG